METVIEARDLRREYVTRRGFWKREKNVVKAVDGISFDVKQGEIFGLLGQNGAGKTTTIKMLTTLLAPTAGICKVLGRNTFGEEKLIRTRINFIFGGEMGVYRRLSARDNLRYFANLYMIPRDQRDERIRKILELVDLAGRADDLVQIARGLINDPEILFMDEPTVGLDPVGARMLRDIIRRLKEDGRTVLLTTHNLAEVEELCDRLVIINKGKVIASGTPSGIRGSYDSLEDAYVKLVEGVSA